MQNHPFIRTEWLLGEENLEKLKNSTVAVFGVGGVGSFTVEALARCGIGHLVLVDYDVVDITNINRQIHAFHHTIGQSKVELMKERILKINPNLDVVIYNEKYNEETSIHLLKEHYDYVVDAIDMVSSKLHLIEECSKKGIKIISSMGAGNKLDPTQFEVTDLYQTSMCPLAKIMRKELRRRGVKNLKVVYSKENPIKPIKDPTDVSHSPGSISFVPSSVGLIIASVVVRELTGIM